MIYLFAIVAAVAVSYVISLAIYPRARCRRCNGRGRFSDPIWTMAAAHRPCPHCNGRGWLMRTGRRALWRVDRHGAKR